MVLFLSLRLHGIRFPVVCSKDWAFCFSWASVELVSTAFSQQHVKLVLNTYEQVKRLQSGGLGNY